MLKEYAVIYTSLHDNLTEEEKSYIYNFVKEGSEQQVMALLLTGECKDKLQENEDKFVKDLFEATPVGHILKNDLLLEYSQISKILARKWAAFKFPHDVEYNMKATPQNMDYEFQQHYIAATKAIDHNLPIAATVISAMIILLSYKIYKSYLSKAARSCKGAKTSELKAACIKKFKIEALKAQIKEITKAKSGCKETKEPKKCTAKLDDKVHSLQVKIQKLSRK